MTSPHTNDEARGEGVPLCIDRERERAHMDAQIERLIPNPKVAASIFRGVRRLCARQWQRSPNWVLAMELYGQGSTYSFAICRRLGIDPDSRTLTPSDPTAGGHSHER